MSTLAPTLEAFFTDRLARQRGASAHTIEAYRDTLRLLLRYAQTTSGIQPSQLDIADLDASMITGFLHHLETGRGNSVRTRNARLAAIHSLFRSISATPCCWSRFNAVCASPNSPASPTPKSGSAQEPTCHAWAKDANTASHHSTPPPRPP